MAHATEFRGAVAGTLWISPCWLVIVFVVAPVGQRHDMRSHSLVVDRALTDNECVHYTRAYKHVSKRCLEVGQAVENEIVVCGDHAGLINSDNQGSSGTSSNSVVQDYVVLCVAPDVDRCAIRVEN